MWYVLIYLDSHDSAKALRESGIYHDMLPLFGEERERWAGEVGAFRFRGDGEGIFAFAILHGQIYNTLRELALEGEPAFRGIVLRDPPEGATQSDGSLDYEYLAARGFRYGAPIEMPSEDEPADTITRQQEIVYVPGMPISILRAQVALGLDAIDELRRAATEVAGFFGGESEFMIEVDVLNSDPAFAGTTDPLMRSAWRRGGSGAVAPEIELTGANVRLQTDLLLADAPLGRDGITRINAFNDTSYTVCIAARNAAAEVSEFLTPIIACHFAPPAVDGTGAPVDGNGAVQTVNDTETLYHRVVVKDYALNILAQFTDAHEYMTRAVGVQPRQARALTGPYADLLGDIQESGGEGNRAFAACNGGDFIDLFAGIVAALTPWLGPLNVALEPFRIALANDVLFPGVGEVFTPGHVSAAVSRGVPTHEYGHFAMCELLRQTEPHTFMTMWIDVSLTSLGGQSVDTAQLWTVEGWADFFTFQVAGGTNYLGFDTSWMGGNHTGVYYCDPARTPPAGVDMHPACLEENVGGSDPITLGGTAFDRLAGTVATVLHDAFDAPGSYLGDTPEYIFAPDGAWTNLGAMGTGARFRAGRGTAVDENVALPPEAIRNIFHHLVWAPNVLISPRAFYDAVARTLTDYGFESDDICAMFALHDPAGDCFNLISRGALDTTDSMPSTPFNLTGRILPGNDAAFEWEDGSYFATGWAYELRGGADVRTGVIPFDLFPSHMEQNLLPNTEYTFTVHTENGSNRSPGAAVLRLTTLAAAPVITNVTGMPGAISVTWAGAGASEYVVEVELPGGEIREVGRTSATNYVINGLDGNTLHRVRVFATNSNGVPSAPSPWESVYTQSVTTIYVATTGSDAATGSVTAPVATVGRALQLAKAAGAQVIDVASGTYLEPAALVVDFPVTILGNSRSEIRVQSLRAGFSSGVSCGSSDFDPAGRGTYSALYLAPGASLYLRDVAVYAAESVNRNACVAAIDSDGTELRLIDAEVGVYDGATTNVPCAVGVLARNMTTVTFSDSDVYGFREVAPIGASSIDAAAACIGGNTDSLIIDDTHFEPFGDGFPNETITSLYGLVVDSNSLRVTRSAVFAHGRAPFATMGAGPIAGLHARVRNNLLIDNSAFITPRGGTNNDALHIESVATPILVSLVHVTANVGDDWGDLGAAPAGHEGNAVRLSGQIGRLEIVNSLMSHAGGYAATGWGAALNIGEVSTTLCDFSIRGNAFAAADRPYQNGRSALVIRDLVDPGFGFLPRGANSYGTYSVDACAAGARVASNLEMYNASPAPDLVTVVPGIDEVGYPYAYTRGATTYTAARDALLNGGISLDSSDLSPYATIGTDLAGAARPMTGAPTIGAYTKP